MISVKGLIKKYGNNTVLKGIDFLVEENPHRENSRRILKLGLCRYVLIFHL